MKIKLDNIDAGRLIMLNGIEIKGIHSCPPQSTRSKKTFLWLNRIWLVECDVTVLPSPTPNAYTVTSVTELIL